MGMLSKIIQERQILREFLNVWPQRLPSPAGVFAATYHFGISELLVLVNITDKPQCVKMNTALNKDFKKILSFRKFEYFGEGEIALNPYAGIWLQK